jgi:hypothetical protein
VWRRGTRDLREVTVVEVRQDERVVEDTGRGRRKLFIPIFDTRNTLVMESFGLYLGSMCCMLTIDGDHSVVLEARHDAGKEGQGVVELLLQFPKLTVEGSCTSLCCASLLLALLP